MYGQLHFLIYSWFIWWLFQ